MTARTAATRYARALFDVALKERVDLQQVEAELSDFARLFAENAAFERVMVNPAVPAPRKRAAVDAIVARAKPLPVVGKLLALLAERDRLVLVPDLLAAYRDRLLDHQHVVRAEVTTAAALDGGQAQRIEQSLAKATGRTVKLATKVDPSIIGGVVARVGSTVYDGSVTRQLERMKQQLVES